MPSPSSLSSGLAWRATLGWALIGRSVIFLVQVEAILVVADAFDVFRLRPDVSRWPILVAVALFFLIAAVQLAAWGWQRSRAAWEQRLDIFLELETGQLNRIRARSASKETSSLGKGPEKEPEAATPAAAEPMPVSPEAATPAAAEPTPVSPEAATPAAAEPTLVSPEAAELAGRIVARFAMEPTWAYQLLAASGVPAATSITRSLQLRDARIVGRAASAAAGLVLIAAAGLAVLLGSGREAPPAARWVVLGVLAAMFLWCYVQTSLVSGKLFRPGLPGTLDDGNEYYAKVEQLLELHRFDLYRALGLRMPRSAREERKMSAGGWRSGDDASYAPPGAVETAEADARIQELADLLRGRQLVAYDGYISWQVDNNRVQLTFSGLPVSGAAGSARIQVEGDSNESHAPFDLSADSQDVLLSQVQESVRAPVKQGMAHATFNFSRRPTKQQPTEPVIWFEIRQLGRFIQLLRVPLAAGQERHSVHA